MASCTTRGRSRAEPQLRPAAVPVPAAAPAPGWRAAGATTGHPGPRRRRCARDDRLAQRAAQPHGVDADHRDTSRSSSASSVVCATGQCRSRRVVPACSSMRTVADGLTGSRAATNAAGDLLALGGWQRDTVQLGPPASGVRTPAGQFARLDAVGQRPCFGSLPRGPKRPNALQAIFHSLSIHVHLAPVAELPDARLADGPSDLKMGCRNAYGAARTNAFSVIPALPFTL